MYETSSEEKKILNKINMLRKFASHTIEINNLFSTLAYKEIVYFKTDKFV